MKQSSIVSEKPSIVWANNALLDEDRLDSKYYDVRFIDKQRKLLDSNIPKIKLKDIITSMNAPIGWQGIPSSAYRERGKGIPLIRIQNIKENQVDLDSVIDVDPQIYYEQPAIQAEKNDIIITRVGTIGRLCKVPNSVDKVAMGQNLTRVSFDTDKVDVDFILAYMNSEYCLNQMVRFAYGGVQPSLTNKNIKDIIIICPDRATQKYIGEKMRCAERLREEIKQLYQQSIDIFNNFVDLEINYNQDDFLIQLDNYKTVSSRPSVFYTRESFDMKLSPQYYHPRRVYLLNKLNKMSCKVKKLSDLTNRITAKSKVNKLPYVGPSCINNQFGYTNPIKPEISTNTVKAEKEDILFCRLRPNLNNITICDSENIQASAEFLQYRVKSDFLYPYYLFFVLRQPIILYQIIDTAVGDRPRVDDELIDDLIIPIIPSEKMDIINSNIKRMLSNVRESEKLISDAKSDVQALIEGTFNKSNIIEKN